MNSNYSVNLSFTADTKQAKAQLRDLQNSLDIIAKNPVGIGETMTKQIREASNAAIDLKVHLQNATNVKTGNLDFTKLNQQLKQSGASLTDYGQKLAAMGPQGQKAFMQLAQAVSQSEIPIRRTNETLTKMGQTLKNTIRWQISASLIQGFTGAISDAYGYAQKLNESLNNIRIVTGLSAEEMTRFAAQANQAAKALSTTTTAYTDAALIFYQQGLEGQAVLDRADAVIKLANVTGQSAKVVSDQMTAVWNNFYDGSKSIEYYADVLTALGAATASSTDEISQGLEKFAAVAETVGLSYEYATAALATVTAQTRQSADVVGTAFKTLFARIQDLDLGETLDDGTTLGSYSEALAKVGINIKEADGSLKDMNDILDEMGAKWEQINKDQQVALAKNVAGIRQYTQLIALMDNWDFFKENLSTAENATGELKRQADIYAESWEAANKRVKASAESIYSALIKDEFFINLSNGFAKILDGVKNFINSIGGVRGVLFALGAVLTKVFGEQMTQGFRNLANSIKMSTVAGRLAAQEARKQQQEQMLKTMSQGIKDNGLEGQKRGVENYRQQIEAQDKLTAKAEHLTDLERQRAQALLDQANNIAAQNQALAESIDLAKERRSDLKMDSATQAIGAGINPTNAFKDVQDVQDSGKALGNYDAAFQKLKNSAERTDAEIQEFIANLKKIDGVKISGDEIRELTKELKTCEMAGDEIPETLRRIKGDLAQVNNQNIEKLAKSYRDAGGTDVPGFRNKLVELNKIEQELIVKNAQLKSSNNQVSDSYKNFEQQLEKMKGLKADWANNLTNLTSSFMSLGMAINSISGLWDTLNNPELSGWEKFASILTSVSMVMMSLTGVTKGLTAARGLFSSITNKDNIIQLAHALTLAKQQKEKKRLERLAIKEEKQRIKSATTTKLESETIKDNTRHKRANAVAADATEKQIEQEAGARLQNATAANIEDATTNDGFKKISNKNTRGLKEGDIGFNKSGKKFTWSKAKNGKGYAGGGYDWVDEKGNRVGNNKISGVKRQMATAPKTTGGASTPTPLVDKAAGSLGGSLKTIAATAAPYLAIAAGIAVIAGTIYLGAEIYNKAETNAKNAEEAAKKAQEQYQKSQEEYNTLITSISSYEDGKKGLEELTKGTLEYREAVMKANDQAMELIKTHEELANAYTINADGLIEINEDALQAVKEKEFNETLKARALSSMADVSANEARSAADRTQLARDIDYDDEGEQWGYAGSVGAGVGVGSALVTAGIGATIGSSVPVIGTIIGGIVGAAIGGIGALIATEISGTEDKKETEALDQILDKYQEVGNSMFATKDEFKRVLEEELHIDDTDLVNALADNTEAIKNWVVNEDNKEKQDKIKWMQAYIANQTATDEKFANLSSAEQQYIASQMYEKRDKASDYSGKVKKLWSDNGWSSGAGFFTNLGGWFTGGVNNKFWDEYLVVVMGEDPDKVKNAQGERYRIRDRGGNNVTLEETLDGGKTWTTVGDPNSLNEKVASKQMESAYALEANSKKNYDIPLAEANKYLSLLQSELVKNENINIQEAQKISQNLLSSFSSTSQIDFIKLGLGRDTINKLKQKFSGDSDLEKAIRIGANNYNKKYNLFEEKFSKNGELKDWFLNLGDNKLNILLSTTFDDEATADEVRATVELAQSEADKQGLQLKSQMASDLKSQLKDTMTFDSFNQVLNEIEEKYKEQGIKFNAVELYQMSAADRNSYLSELEVKIQTDLYQKSVEDIQNLKIKINNMLGRGEDFTIIETELNKLADLEEEALIRSSYLLDLGLDKVNKTINTLNKISTLKAGDTISAEEWEALGNTAYQNYFKKMQDGTYALVEAASGLSLAFQKDALNLNKQKLDLFKGKFTNDLETASELQEKKENVYNAYNDVKKAQDSLPKKKKKAEELLKDTTKPTEYISGNTNIGLGAIVEEFKDYFSWEPRYAFDNDIKETVASYRTEYPGHMEYHITPTKSSYRYTAGEEQGTRYWEKIDNLDELVFGDKPFEGGSYYEVPQKFGDPIIYYAAFKTDPFSPNTVQYVEVPEVKLEGIIAEEKKEKLMAFYNQLVDDQVLLPASEEILNSPKKLVEYITGSIGNTYTELSNKKTRLETVYENTETALGTQIETIKSNIDNFNFEALYDNLDSEHRVLQFQAVVEELNNAKETIEKSALEKADKNELNEKLDEATTLNWYYEYQASKLEDKAREQRDFSAEQIQEYSENLTLMNESLKNNIDIVGDVATANLRLDKGISDLRDNFKSWKKVLETTDEKSVEYSETLSDITTAMADMMGISEGTIRLLGEDYIKKHFSDIERIINGDKGALRDLRKEMAGDYIAKFKLEAPEKEILERLIDDISTQIPITELGAKINIDDSSYKAKLKQMLTDGKISLGQFEEMLNMMGAEYAGTIKTITQAEYDAIKEPEEKKQYITTTTVSADVPVFAEFREKTPPPGVPNIDRAHSYSWTQEVGRTQVAKTYINAGDIDLTQIHKKIDADYIPKTRITGNGAKPRDYEAERLDDIRERYEDINHELERIEDNLSDIDRKMERTWGVERLELYEKKLDELDKKSESLAEKRDEAYDYYESDSNEFENAFAALGLSGVTIERDKNGYIINFEEIDKALWEKDTSMKQQATRLGSSDAQEDFMKPWEKNRENYEFWKGQLINSEQAAREAENAWEENFWEKQDVRMEEFNYTIELRVELNERDLKRIEYYLSKYEEDYEDFGNFWQYKQEEIDKDTNELIASYNDLLALQAETWEDEAAYQEKITELTGTIYDNLGAYQENLAFLRDEYSNQIEKMTEDIDKLANSYDQVTTKIEHYKQVMELTGQEANYDLMGQLLDAQANTALSQALFQGSQLAMWREELAKLEASHVEGNEASEKAIETMRQKVQEGEASALEFYTNYLSILQEKLENALLKADKTLETAFTNGVGFDQLDARFERAAASQEEWYTATNKVYETTKMIRNVQKEIDKTTSNTAKQRLKQFQTEIQMLQNQEKLSKHELDLQQKKYDLLLAELALEEAKNAVSTVTLRRDAEGNFGYIYTADQDKIADAQQKYDDAENALYNAQLEGLNGYAEKAKGVVAELSSALSDLNSRKNELTPEQYTTERSEIIAFYKQQLLDYGELYNLSMEEMGAGTLMLEEAWSTGLINIDELISNYDANVTTYINNVNSAYEDFSTHHENAKEQLEALIGMPLDLTPGNANEVLGGIATQTEEISKLWFGDPANPEDKGLMGKLIDGFEKIRTTIDAWAVLNAVDIKTIENKTDSILDKANEQTTTEPEEKETPIEETPSEETTPETVAPSWENVSTIFENFNRGIWTETGWDKRKAKAISAGYSEEEVEMAMQMIKYIFGQGKRYDQAKTLLGFDTGGYTGSWGPEGKVAMLHEKELVLNPEDTINFLEALDLSNQMMTSVERLAEAMSLENRLNQLNSVFDKITSMTDKLEQNVHIEASFPGVTDRYEVEEALNNIINTAAQYAFRD